jgi:DnaJ-class molecular chaperone
MAVIGDPEKRRKFDMGVDPNDQASGGFSGFGGHGMHGGMDIDPSEIF